MGQAAWLPATRGSSLVLAGDDSQRARLVDVVVRHFHSADGNVSPGRDLVTACRVDPARQIGEIGAVFEGTVFCAFGLHQRSCDVHEDLAQLADEQLVVLATGPVTDVQHTVGVDIEPVDGGTEPGDLIHLLGARIEDCIGVMRELFARVSQRQGVAVDREPAAQIDARVLEADRGATAVGVEAVTVKPVRLPGFIAVEQVVVRVRAHHEAGARGACVHFHGHSVSSRSIIL